MPNSQFAMAVHVLAMMANSCDDRLKSEYIAKSVNTNPVVIRRLLRNLFEADLVVSQAGACGGSCLTRRPEEIRLADIYKAVSRGEVFSMHPQTPNQNCPIGKNIQVVLGKIQNDIDEAIEIKLSQYTLRDVIKSVESEKRELVNS